MRLPGKERNLYRDRQDRISSGTSADEGGGRGNAGQWARHLISLETIRDMKLIFITA